MTVAELQVKNVHVGSRLRLPAGRPALWRGGAGVLVMIVVLELASRAGFVNPRFLPPFSEVALRLVQLLGDPAFLSSIGSTAVTWAVGLSLTFCVAVPIGILLGLSKTSYRLSRTVIEMLRPLPPIALIPLAILVVGQGIEMKLLIAVYAAMWPILFNTIYGVHGVDPKTVDMARSFSMSRTDILRRVLLPGAAPFIFAGLRLSSAIVLVAVITVELVAGASTGIGSFIAQSRSSGTRIPDVYAGILMSGVLGLVINMAMLKADQSLFGWARQEGS